MRWKLDGVAFIGLHDDEPRPIDHDRCGRRCESTVECATGPVKAISYARSCAHGAAAIHFVRPDEEVDRLRARLAGHVLHYQPIRGELDVVSMPVAAAVADERGRGEPPWDAVARLDADVAVEFGARLRGIRELRLRDEAMARIVWGEPVVYVPADHAEEIVAIARKGI